MAGRHRACNLRYRSGVPRWQRIFVISCVAVIGYALAYTLADFGQWPRLMYFPFEREWGWYRTPPGPAPMPYLGLVLWGVLGAAFGILGAVAGCRLRRQPVSDTMLKLWGSWALTAFAFAGLYFTWNLWPF